MTVDYLTPEQTEQAITVLLGAADSTVEIRAITRVAIRAGFLWTCPDCSEPNYPTRESCTCGGTR